MPRLKNPLPSFQFYWPFAWKVLLIMLVVGSAIMYIAERYISLHPPPRDDWSTEIPKSGPPVDRQLAVWEPLLEKLNATPKQKEKVRALSKETTSSRTLRKNVLKELTAEQRELLKFLEKELAAERRKKEEQEKARRAKLYPGGDWAAAKAGDAEVRRRYLERQRAAKAKEKTSEGNER